MCQNGKGILVLELEDMSYIIRELFFKYKKPRHLISGKCSLGVIFVECALAFGEHSPKPFLVQVNFSEMGS